MGPVCENFGKTVKSAFFFEGEDMGKGFKLQATPRQKITPGGKIVSCLGEVREG